MRLYLHPNEVISHQHPDAEVYDLFQFSDLAVARAEEMLSLVAPLHFPSKEVAYEQKEAA